MTEANNLQVILGIWKRSQDGLVRVRFRLAEEQSWRIYWGRCRASLFGVRWRQ